VTGPCAIRNERGQCISNVDSDETLIDGVDRIGEFSSCRSLDPSDESGASVGCYYNVEPYPLKDKASILAAYCSTIADFLDPAASGCSCSVFVRVEGYIDAVQCDSCELLPSSGSDLFEVVYDCSEYVESSCASRLEGGQCVSNLPDNDTSDTESPTPVVTESPTVAPASDVPGASPTGPSDPSGGSDQVTSSPPTGVPRDSNGATSPFSGGQVGASIDFSLKLTGTLSIILYLTYIM
jgi:hypothetical protein